MTLEDRVRACLARHPEWTAQRIANSTGARQAEVEVVRAGLPIFAPRVEPPAPGPAPSPASGPPSLISLDKVIARYDIKSSILREIGELPKGKLIVEAELCQRTTGMDRNRFRRTVENNPDAFRPLRIKLRLDDVTEGKWYWGKESDIAEAQRIVNA
jgi:hypothetical protein